MAARQLGDQELVEVTNTYSCGYMCNHSLPLLPQHIGVVLWGVCLPLLQHNLRVRLLPTLTMLASALEQVDR